ncbi:rRNA-processing protein utp21, partial [Teratosphaeriaceae sp. CCFEE 6253]
DGKKVFYRGQGRHGSVVVGLAVDKLNKTVVSAGKDGKVKFWDFGTGLLRQQLDWSASTGISAMRFQRSSELVAFVCTDGSVRVVDLSTAKLIRELWPSRPPLPQLRDVPISDAAFSPDGHWIAASLGALIVLWDLPTGHLVDAFLLQAACTSLAFSPTGEYLALATAGSVGVEIWGNRALFMQVSARHIGAEELGRVLEAGQTRGATTSGEGGMDVLTAAAEGGDEVEEEDDVLAMLDEEPDVDQLGADLLSLSLVPKSWWQNLLHLDLIRARNKPVEPPKKPAKAPFFLPSLQDRQGPAPRAEASGAVADGAKEQSRVLQLTQRGGQGSAFAAALQVAGETLDYAAVVEELKALPPAAADIQLRSLSAEGDVMRTFVRALTWLLHRRRDFELGQTWMSVFLRLHGDLVVQSEELRAAVGLWREALEGERRRVGGLGGYAAGVVGYLRAARV